MKNNTRTLRIGAAFSIALLALTGCSTDSSGAGSESETSQEAAATQAAAAITITDAWVKAAEAGGMTGAFGVIENASDSDITVVSVASQAAPMVELHETVVNDSGDMVMRQVEGGFVIPANSTFALEPGANHIMLMELPDDVTAGSELTFTLTLDDGSTVDFTTIAKDYSGANEDYDDIDHGSMDHGDMDHGEMKH